MDNDPVTTQDLPDQAVEPLAPPEDPTSLTSASTVTVKDQPCTSVSPQDKTPGRKVHHPRKRQRKFENVPYEAYHQASELTLTIMQCLGRLMKVSLS